MSASGIRAGQMIDGYQAQAQAPVEFIRGERQRHLGGHYVRGAWSDPWWAYDPERGWAIVKRWRSKQQNALTWDTSGERGRYRKVAIEAIDELIAEPYTAAVAVAS
jgi:hypothetical protein